MNNITQKRCALINERNDKKFLLALLLAIIIHLIIALFIALHKSLNLAKEELMVNELLNKEINKIKRQQAPVTFKNDEQPPEGKKESQQTIDLSQLNTLQHEAALIPGASSDKTVIDAENVAAPDQEDHEENKLDQPHETFDDMPAQEEQEIEEPIQPTPMQQQPSALEKTMTSTTHTLEPKKDALQKRGRRKKRATTPVILKREYKDAPKLKNVIEGFTTYMNQEGNNAHLERAGSKNGFFNLEEAKLIAYYNRVIDFFKKTDPDYPDNVVRALRWHAEKNAGKKEIGTTFKLVITKDGKLEEIRILESSGVQEYDDFIKEKFKKAAPYPPIANHLNKEKIIFPIYIYTLLKSPRVGFFF